MTTAKDQDRAEQVRQRLQSSIDCMMAGKKTGPCIGVEDMQFCLDSLMGWQAARAISAREQEPLSRADRDFLIMVFKHPLEKLRDFLTPENGCSYPDWKRFEDEGLIRCVGNWKWKAVDDDKLLARISGAPTAANDARDAALRQARDALTEIALDVVASSLEQARTLYAGYPRDGLGRNITQAEKDMAIVKDALSSIDAAMAQKGKEKP